VAITRPSAKPKTEATSGATTAAGDKSVTQVVSELWELTVDYAKQEIRDPVRGLGSYLLWGSLSMLLIGIGMVLLALGALRALQTETGSTFDGSLSWAPYGIVLAGAIVVLGIVGLLVTKGKK
jgi:hypothetical protein